MISRGRPPKIGAEKIERVICLSQDSDMSAREIAEEVGIGKRTVFLIRKKYL